VPDIEAIITSSMETAGDPIVDTTGDEGAAPDATPEVDAAAPAADAADAPPPAADDAVTPPPAEEEVPDLSEVELAGKSLPLHRHKAVLTKARKAAEALEAKLKGLEWASVPDAQEKLNAIQVADTNPELFAQVLFNDPKFGPIFKSLMGSASPAPPADVPAAATSAAAVERPQPDVLLPDGTVGYSQAAQEQMLAWHAAQMEEKFNKTLEERFGKVEPILQEREAQNAYTKEVERQREVVQHARKNWVQFEKHEHDIRQLINAKGNEKMTLEEAYRQVVVPKLVADRDTMRKEILAEQTKKADKVIAPPAPKAAPVAGKSSTEDIIRGAYEKLSA